MDPILLAVTEVARIGNMSTFGAARVLSAFLLHVAEHQPTTYERDNLQALARKIASIGGQ